MNKKVYEKPTVEVKELVLESAILAGSGVTASFDDENTIDQGYVDARPRSSFDVWGGDE